jgi:hypothetical protein
VPEGLKLGAALKLDLYRPGREESAAGGGSVGGVLLDSEFTIHRYWGSSPVVLEEQPEVVQLKTLRADQKAAVRSAITQARQSTPLFCKPDWTTAFWSPGPGKEFLAREAALPGTYSLRSNYVGAADLAVPGEISFLEPIEFSMPDLRRPVGLNSAIAFEWRAIPNVLAYHAQVIGVKGRKTLVLWSSSESEPELSIDFENLGPGEVRELLGKRVLMAPNRTHFVVPSGIFKDCELVVLRMIGYGPVAEQEGSLVAPRLETCTVVNVVLQGNLDRYRTDGFGAFDGIGGVGPHGFSAGGDYRRP